MKETKLTSTNGRWGLTVVHPNDVDITAAPVEGELESLGSIEGHKTFVFTPKAGTGRWYILEGDTECLAGCKIVTRVGLQSFREATLLVLRPFAAYKRFGYRRRSSRIIAWRKGEPVELPPSVMAAMGLIPAERKRIDVEPPALDGALAEALKKSGVT